MTVNSPHRTLYICYFGLREPLVQTQVLPYLRELGKKSDLDVHLLTFEREIKENWTNAIVETEKMILRKQNIEWSCLPYHKSPRVPATLYDVLSGARFVIKIARKKNGFSIIHARAHVPMLIAMLGSQFTKCKTIFDIRGLMAEEYADAGILRKNSVPFRIVKYIERKGIEKASEIVVLTNRMRDYLIENRLKNEEQIEVIPCCVDVSRVEQSEDSNVKNTRFELIYAGSVTGLYLLKEMACFFLELRKYKPDAYFRVLTAAPAQFVNDTFRDLGIEAKDFAVEKVLPNEVPKYLKGASLGISFRKPTFAQIAASPTKIPEYLACGLPVISNYGIGDTDLLLQNEEVGICLESFSKVEMAKSVLEILDILNEPGIREKCIAVSHKYFDLVSVGGQRYKNVYDRLLSDIGTD